MLSELDWAWTCNVGVLIAKSSRSWRALENLAPKLCFGGWDDLEKIWKSARLRLADFQIFSKSPHPLKHNLSQIFQSTSAARRLCTSIYTSTLLTKTIAMRTSRWWWWCSTLDYDDAEDVEGEDDAVDDKKLRRVGGSQGFLHEESLCQQLRGFFGPCKVQPSMINKVKPSIKRELLKPSTLKLIMLRSFWETQHS